MRRPPRCTPFPYRTPFRSVAGPVGQPAERGDADGREDRLLDDLFGHADHRHEIEEHARHEVGGEDVDEDTGRDNINEDGGGEDGFLICDSHTSSAKPN